MTASFYLYYVLLIVTLYKPIVDFVYYLFDVSLDPFFKLLSITVYTFGVFFFIYKKKIHSIILFALLCFAFVKVFLFTSVAEDINYFVLFSHFYYGTLPFFASYFGFYLYRQNSFALYKNTQKIANIALYVLILLVPAYLLLHNFTDKWSYFGYSSGIVFAFILTSRYANNYNLLKLFSFLLYEVLTGKRSTIVLWMVIIFKRNAFSLILACIFLLLFYFSFDGIQGRYIYTLNIFSSESLKDLSLATGGRSDEWISIYESIENFYYWLIVGGGFGEEYLLYSPLNDYIEYRHYSHLSVLTYAYVYGIYGIFFYFYVLYFLLRNRNIFDYDIFYMYILIMTFLSIFGASMLTYPMYWVFLGFLFSSLSQRRSVISR